MTLARKEFAGAAAATTLTSSMTSGAPIAGQTFTVASGTNYPTGAYAGGFVVVVDAGTTSEEKILCSARSGNTLTVATSGRGWDGTTATSHGGGVTAGTVAHCIDGDTMTDVSAHVYDTTRNDHTQYQQKSLLTTAGDTLYATAASTWQRLGIGSAFQSLQTNAGATAPAWGASARSTLTAAGDILYASAANTLARLAKGTDGQVLTLASGLPLWASATDVLASLEYTGGSGSYSLTSATLTAVDTANLRLTFTAPSSGNVMVTLMGPTDITTVAGWINFGILEAAATVGSPRLVHYEPTLLNNLVINSKALIKVTGLVAGSSHTYDFAWQCGSGCTAAMSKGAPNGMTMTVEALP